MKRNSWFKKKLKRLECFCIAFCLGIALLPLHTSAGVEKESKSRAIAIVFDNSGSMYIRGNQAWCRATYAIEVFAAMMNEGDVLSVFPMWELKSEGSTYTSLENPLTIRSRSDLARISKMYTPEAGATPIETIQSASDGLKGMTADEKWLIVLTDGDEFYEDNKSLGSKTAERLSTVLTECNKTLNVMYLGIGSGAIIPEVTEKSRYTYYADKAADSKTILSKLTAMSNNIFGRDVLPGSGNDISFDLSMSKLIVFVQGAGVKDVTLSAKGSNNAIPSVESYSPHYGEMGAGGKYKGQFGIDQSLQGVLMTYENVDAGEYAIGYSGNASSVSVYYEPDVDLQLFMLDKKGVPAQTDTAYPGMYTVNAQLIDKNGVPTDSALLGKTEYVVSCTVNDETAIAKGNAAGYMEIELEEGDVVDFGAEVTYLSGYHIAKSGTDMGWPVFTVLPKRDFSYEVRLDIAQKYIVLSKIAQAKPIEANIYVNGEPASAEQCEKFTMQAESDEIPLIVERKADGSGFLLKVDPEKPVKTGKHPFSCRLVGTDDNDDPVSVEDRGELTFKPYPQWLIYLALFLLLAVLALLIWLYLNVKVLPKRIDVIKTVYTVDGESVSGKANCMFSGGNGKKGTLTIKTPKCPTNPFAKGSVMAEVEAVSPRRVRSALRGLHVTNVTADNHVNMVKLGSAQFIRDPNGKLIRAGGKANAPVAFDIYDGAQCSIGGETFGESEGSASLSMMTKLKFD